MKSEGHPPPDHLEWTVHPMKRSPKTAFGLTLLILAVPITVYLSYGDLWLGLVALMVLTASLRAFYLPTHYVLNRSSVTCSCFPVRASRPWEAFKGWQDLDGAVRLSVFLHPSRLDPYRGLLLRFEGDGASIKEYVRNRLKVDRRPLDTS